MILLLLSSCVWAALRSFDSPPAVYADHREVEKVATDDDRLQVLGQLGGSYSAVAVQGDVLFVGIGQRLFSYSISNPEQPELLGQTTNLQARVQQIWCDGSYAYVGVADGLHIVRIDDPTHLVLTASFEIVGSVQDIAKSGSLLVISDGYRGFYLLDVTNPSLPRLISHRDITDQPGQLDIAGVDLAGQLLAVVDGVGLHIFDISNPTVPVERAFYKTQGYASDVVLSVPFALIADGDRLRIIDLTDMDNPVLTASVSLTGEVSRLELSGQRAYLANGRGGVAIVDVSDPAHPWTLSTIDTPGSAMDLALDGDYVYVADGANALQIIKVSQSGDASLIKTAGLPANAGGLFVDDHYAYVADGYGLRIIDVSDVTQPRLTAFISTPGQAKDVFVQDDRAYVADGIHGVRVIDITNKQAPVEIAYYDTPGYAGDVVIYRGYGYIADGAAGLQVFRVSPTSIEPLGTYNSPGYAEAVAMWDHFALLADGQQGVQIIDVSNPLAPQWRSSVATTPYAQGITVAGSNMFVANAYGETISRIEIRDPSNPKSLETFSVPGYAYDVTVGRHVAFIPVELKGMQMIDVQVPRHAVAAGGYKTGAKVRRVVLHNDYLFLLDVDGGLTILKYNAPLYTFLPYQAFPSKPEALDTPILSPITNSDGDGVYVVEWSLVSRATEYILEQATNLRFSDARQVYRGPGHSAHVTEMGAGRYYYRVLAKSPVGESSWSHPQPVDVLWEKEPNDDGKSQANGPLVLGLTYHGSFREEGDIKDYYYFYLDRPQSLLIGLVNPSGRDYDLALRTSSLKLIGYSAHIGAGQDEVINTAVLPAGRYLIQVYNPELDSSPLSYILRIHGRN